MAEDQTCVPLGFRKYKALFKVGFTHSVARFQLRSLFLFLCFGCDDCMKKGFPVNGFLFSLWVKRASVLLPAGTNQVLHVYSWERRENTGLWVKTLSLSNHTACIFAAVLQICFCWRRWAFQCSRLLYKSELI